MLDSRRPLRHRCSIEAQGKVTVVSPAVDPQSTTVEIWVEAPNPGEQLRPGGNCAREIMAETVADALVVPAEALLHLPKAALS